MSLSAADRQLVGFLKWNFSEAAGWDYSSCHFTDYLNSVSYVGSRDGLTRSILSYIGFGMWCPPYLGYYYFEIYRAYSNPTYTGSGAFTFVCYSSGMRNSNGDGSVSANSSAQSGEGWKNSSIFCMFSQSEQLLYQIGTSTSGTNQGPSWGVAYLWYLPNGSFSTTLGIAGEGFSSPSLNPDGLGNPNLGENNPTGSPDVGTGGEGGEGGEGGDGGEGGEGGEGSNTQQTIVVPDAPAVPEVEVLNPMAPVIERASNIDISTPSSSSYFYPVIKIPLYNGSVANLAYDEGWKNEEFRTWFDKFRLFIRTLGIFAVTIVSFMSTLKLFRKNS